MTVAEQKTRSEEGIPLQPQLLWTPKNVQDTNIHKFRQMVNQRFSLSLDTYDDLHKWSVANIAEFWSAVWDFTGIVVSVKSMSMNDIIDLATTMDTIPKWFSSARLNFAENILEGRQPEELAIVATGELQDKPRKVTHAELYSQVIRCRECLKQLGVKEGDRIAAYIPNCVEAIVVMLAAASIGAIWSSTSPDFGTTGVLDRFSQIAPKILFSVNAVAYNGKVFDHLDKVSVVVKGLPSLETVVIVPFVPTAAADLTRLPHHNAQSFDDFMNSHKVAQLPTKMSYAQLPFDHPLFILYSSGTTGKPKCIVHSAGGLLLQLKKEHVIHGDVTSKDVFLYYTTTGWMMWNWLVGAMSTGATVVLFDGSPFKPGPGILWELVDTLGITHFGTSAKYIQSLQDIKYSPKAHHSLSTLKAIYSTGSPLKPESFDFVYSDIHPDVLLGSITGGTDICSLFCGHNTALPVYRGEIQCRMLGLDVQAWNGQGNQVLGQSADLVCCKPFPCMPVEMWNDPTNAKYAAAYFSVYPHVWYQGDFVWINPNTGGVVMLGRSDGTLNPSGIRFGSAEIYNITDRFEQIEDALCVGQKIPHQDDERVVLFLKMRDGNAFDDELVAKVKTQIRKDLSARHVPAFVLPITDIPHTINGKKVEVAVKKIISGENVVASGTLVNPDSLDLYRNIPELKF